MNEYSVSLKQTLFNPILLFTYTSSVELIIFGCDVFIKWEDECGKINIFVSIALLFASPSHLFFLLLRKNKLD